MSTSALDLSIASVISTIRQRDAQQRARRSRPYEVRYATKYYSNALWSTHRDYEQAVAEKNRLVGLITSSPYAGHNQILKSIEIL